MGRRLTMEDAQNALLNTLSERVKELMDDSARVRVELAEVKGMVDEMRAALDRLQRRADHQDAEERARVSQREERMKDVWRDVLIPPGQVWARWARPDPRLPASDASVDYVEFCPHPSET